MAGNVGYHRSNGNRLLSGHSQAVLTSSKLPLERDANQTAPATPGAAFRVPTTSKCRCDQTPGLDG
jgi:hypothetical protein